MGIKAEKIDLKIKRLRYYKVYDYSVLSDNLKDDRDSISVKMSRKFKKNEIIKIGKGKFYKRHKTSSSQNKAVKRFNSPCDKSSLRYNQINPSKYPVFVDLFWSNRNIPIPLDNYISRILSENIVGYLPQLRYFFGDRKIIEVYLNNFYPHNRKMKIEEFLDV